MRPYVVLNPGAGSADPDAVAAALSRLPAAVVGACEAPGDAPRLAVEAARAGFDPVVAAGGDGTVSAVAHGLSSLTSPPRLAILPLGTGNDLARTLAIPLAIDEAVDALLAEIVRSIDLIDVESDDKTRTTAINVSAGGFSGEVDEAMTSERKRRWGPLAYVWTALQVLPDIESYRTRLWLDGGPLLEIDALNVIVANGRTVGGGRAVAPLANPEDGLLDVVLVHRGSAVDLARIAARLLAGDYLNDDLVTLHRAAAVRVESDPPMPWNADGELVTRAGVTFTVRPRALRLLVGPGYSPDPPRAA